MNKLVYTQKFQNYDVSFISRIYFNCFILPAKNLLNIGGLSVKKIATRMKF